ncbi:MAG: nuclear transport factor 2 family protein [Pseudomonadota bacterium]
MRALIAVFAVLWLSSPAVAGEKKEAHPEYAAIEAAVFDYFHGQGEASAERLNRAFAAEHATMVGVVKNDAGEEMIRSWKDMDTVLSNWAANDNPPGTERSGEIMHMHVQDGRLAVVVFRSADRFYDALTLAKIDGDWKIIQKAFVLQ